MESVFGYVKEIAGDSSRVIDTLAARKVPGVSGLDNWRTKRAIASAHKTAEHTSGIDVIARDVVTLVNPDRSC